MTLEEVMKNFTFLNDEEKKLIEEAGFQEGHVDNFKVMEHFIIKGRLDTVKKAIENGIDVNLAENGGMGSSLLQIAIRFDQMDIFEYLIEKGADINFQDLVGWTPLMEAIMDDKPAFGKRLVELGCDLDIANQRGATAKMLAMKFSRQDFLGFL
jgi:ankyrin repeat protein